MNDEYVPLIFAIPFLVLIVFMATQIFSLDTEDNDIWDPAIKQADNFVYHHKNREGNRAIFYLNDENDEYICEAVVNMAEENVTIWNHEEIIVGYYSNKKKSEKLFKLLYPKIPKEVRDAYLPRSEVSRRMKNMK